MRSSRSSHTPPMSVLDTIRRELDDAEATGWQKIVQVRVTTDALPASPVTVPITPERARTMSAMRMMPDGIVADPASYEGMLEVLLHPEDWQDVLADAERFAVQMATRPGEPNRIFGIPVVR